MKSLKQYIIENPKLTSEQIRNKIHSDRMGNSLTINYNLETLINANDYFNLTVGGKTKIMHVKEKKENTFVCDCFNIDNCDVTLHLNTEKSYKEFYHGNIRMIEKHIFDEKVIKFNSLYEKLNSITIGEPLPKYKSISDTHSLVLFMIKNPNLLGENILKKFNELNNEIKLENKNSRKENLINYPPNKIISVKDNEFIKIVSHSKTDIKVEYIRTYIRDNDNKYRSISFKFEKQKYLGDKTFLNVNCDFDLMKNEFFNLKTI